MVIAGFSGLFMQSFSIGDALAQVEAFGVFDFLLPFLLIFAVIYGILTSTNIMGANKGINMIISLVIALMALRLEFVSLFFTGLFPRFALVLSSLVVGMILVFMFVPKDQARPWFTTFAVLGIIGALAVVVSTFSSFNYFGSGFWQEYTGIIITAVLLIAAVIAIINSANADDDPYVGGKKIARKPDFGPFRGGS